MGKKRRSRKLQPRYRFGFNQSGPPCRSRVRLTSDEPVVDQVDPVDGQVLMPRTPPGPEKDPDYRGRRR